LDEVGQGTDGRSNAAPVLFALMLATLSDRRDFGDWQLERKF
jgi:hypothetical protein